MTAAGKRAKANPPVYPLGLLKAQFIRYFGAGFYCNPRLWATWDGVIPWQLFYARLRDMHNVMALERLNLAQAFTQALAVTSGDKGSIAAARDTFNKWVRLAYPDQQKDDGNG